MTLSSSREIFESLPSLALALDVADFNELLVPWPILAALRSLSFLNRMLFF